MGCSILHRVVGKLPYALLSHVGDHETYLISKEHVPLVHVKFSTAACQIEISLHDETESNGRNR